MTFTDFKDNPILTTSPELTRAAKAAHAAWCEANKTHLKFESMDYPAKLMWMYIALKSICACDEPEVE